MKIGNKKAVCSCEQTAFLVYGIFIDAIESIASIVSIIFINSLRLQFVFKHGEGAVFLGFHDFAFARAFVVDATEVENAVDDDAVELFFVTGANIFGIGAHGVERDEEVAADAVALGVVEGDDVRVVVVLQELAVDFEDFFVVNEDVGDVPAAFVMSSGNGFDPGCCGSCVDVGEGDVDAVVCYHVGGLAVKEVCNGRFILRRCQLRGGVSSFFPW